MRTDRQRRERKEVNGRESVRMGVKSHHGTSGTHEMKNKCLTRLKLDAIMFVLCKQTMNKPANGRSADKSGRAGMLLQR